MRSTDGHLIAVPLLQDLQVSSLRAAYSLYLLTIAPRLLWFQGYGRSYGVSAHIVSYSAPSAYHFFGMNGLKLEHAQGVAITDEVTNLCSPRSSVAMAHTSRGVSVSDMRASTSHSTADKEMAFRRRSAPDVLLGTNNSVSELQITLRQVSGSDARVWCV